MPPKKNTNKNNKRKNEGAAPTQTAVDASSAVGGRPAKVGNYSIDEDIALCKAFVNVSSNPLTGTDQKAIVFWGRVQQRFTTVLQEMYPGESFEENFPQPRDHMSLMNRYKKMIQKTVHVFMKPLITWLFLTEP